MCHLKGAITELYTSRYVLLSLHGKRKGFAAGVRKLTCIMVKREISLPGDDSNMECVIAAGRNETMSQQGSKTTEWVHEHLHRAVHKNADALTKCSMAQSVVPKHQNLTFARLHAADTAVIVHAHLSIICWERSSVAEIMIGLVHACWVACRSAVCNVTLSVAMSVSTVTSSASHPASLRYFFHPLVNSFVQMFAMFIMTRRLFHHINRSSVA